MFQNLPKTWSLKLEDFLNKQTCNDLELFVETECSSKTIYPDINNIFNAFKLVDFNKVKVVILGQDPYHNDGQAHGLSFSVLEGVKTPPSLKNIYKEMESDLSITKDFTKGDLTFLASQGVLLLNSVLTVEKNNPGSHAKKGWEQFTDEVIKKLNQERDGLVFILWGNYAKKKGKIISSKKHLILESNHPSPFSAYKGFFGCKHFSKTNDYLKAKKIPAINWYDKETENQALVF